jgi:hypothetical protein
MAHDESPFAIRASQGLLNPDRFIHRLTVTLVAKSKALSLGNSTYRPDVEKLSAPSPYLPPVAR